MSKGPHPIADVLAQLMARHGFARRQAAAARQKAWREAAGPLAAYTRVGSLRRGRLEITVANSTLLQELSFQKPAILKALARLLPDEPVGDLRFRVGAIQ